MQSYGIQSMLKEGHKHLSGLDEAVIKNIDACKQLSTITRTSLGPNGNIFLYICALFLFLIEISLDSLVYFSYSVNSVVNLTIFLSFSVVL